MNALDHEDPIYVAESERGHIEPWKWVVGVIAALAAAPFLAMALGITVVLLAPFAIPVLPIIAFTLAAQEKPELVPIGLHRRRARLAHAHAH